MYIHVHVVTVTRDLQYLVIKPTCNGSGCSVLSIHVHVARELSAPDGLLNTVGRSHWLV